MSTFLNSNNAQTTLAGSISNVAVTANLQAGAGALFPNPAAGQYFVATIISAANGVDNEIVWVTNRVGDTVTMIRGQEGTSAQNWSANDLFEQRVTAGQMQALVQLPILQAQGTNYSTDSGAANNYICAMNPVTTVPIVGAPLRVLIANTNTGASTLNYGAGAVNIVRRDGSALIGGELLVGSVAYFQIRSGDVMLMQPAPATAAAISAGTDTQAYVTPKQLADAVIVPIPAGVMLPYGGTSAPSGWLLCAGQQVNRVTYAALFTAIGVAFGVGDGSTTFNVPDLRGRVAAGLDNMGGSAAGRLTSQTVAPNGNTLGANGGVQEKQFAYSGTTGFDLQPGVSAANGGQAVSAQPHDHLYSGNTTLSGIIQPTLMTNYIIKT
jgi:microcystin-dependent protein